MPKNMVTAGQQKRSNEVELMKKTKDFQRNERQKEVSDAYRENWDKIFKKEEKLIKIKDQE